MDEINYRKRCVRKALASMIIMTDGFLLGQLTPAGELFSRGGIQRGIGILRGWSWAPIVFVPLYALAVGLGIPGTFVYTLFAEALLQGATEASRDGFLLMALSGAHLFLGFQPVILQRRGRGIRSPDPEIQAGQTAEEAWFNSHTLTPFTTISFIPRKPYPLRASGGHPWEAGCGPGRVGHGTTTAPSPSESSPQGSRRFRQGQNTA